MRDVVIVSAVRTPIGKFGKSLGNVPAVKLGETAIKEAVKYCRAVQNTHIARIVSSIPRQLPRVSAVSVEKAGRKARTPRNVHTKTSSCIIKRLLPHWKV